MFCIRCGGKLPDGAAFCPACGAKAGPETEARPEEAAPPTACAACGSRHLRKVRKGEYRCEYCGSRFFTDGQDASASEEDVETELMALFEEAAAYESKDNISAELKVLLKGLDLDPENCLLLLKLGRAYWRLGLDEKSLEYLRKAEQLYPDNALVYFNLANIHLTRGEYAAAKPLYEKSLAAIEANPLSVSANDVAVSYANYGNCLGRMGDLKGAKKYLSIAKAKGYSSTSLANVCRLLGLNPKRL